MESVLQQVEWVTLLFFMAMFITMECLARLGLIKWIGKQTEYLILMADERMRLTIAIIIILWVNTLTSIYFADFFFCIELLIFRNQINSYSSQRYHLQWLIPHRLQQ